MSVVGDLVVQLSGNMKPLTSTLGAARGAIGTFASSIPGIVAGIAAPLAGMFAIGKSISAFHDAEKAGKQLDAALATTGNTSGVTSGEIKKLASDLQKVTNFEDDATVAASALLVKFSNVKGDVFKQAIVSAADFAAATGRDLPSSISLIGKALNDPVRGMMLLRKQGVMLSTEQQAQVKAMVAAGDMAGAQAVVLGALQGKFGGTAKAMADPLTILGNMVGDIAENIGSLFLPSLQAIADFIISDIMPGAGSMTEQFGNWGKILAGYVKDALQFVRDSITVVAFAVENIGPISELVFKSMELYAVQFASSVAHFFTGTMPALLDWLGKNWQDVFFTIGDLAMTVFINIGQNIRNIMSAAWDFITSGGTSDFDVAWEPLTKGYMNTIAALPPLPTRAVGPIEKGLIGDVDKLSTKLTDDLGDAMNNAAKDAAEKVKPEMPDFSGGNGVTGEIKDKAGKKTGAEAAVQGSKEALSSIFSNMRGDNDPQKRLVKLAEEQNRLLAEQNDLIEEGMDGEEVVDI